MKPAVSIRSLGYRYRGQEGPALDGVDLEVAEREFVVVTGPLEVRKITLRVSLNDLISSLFTGESWEDGTCTS